MILVTKTEIQDIQETLIKLIETFPELPPQVKKDGIFFEQLKPKNVSMCLSTIVNPRKSSIYVDDSYTSKYQFRLLLQTMDVTNQERIDSQAIFSKIGEWLFGRVLVKPDGTSYSLENFPELKNKRRFLNSWMSAFPKLVQRLPPNIEITEAKFVAEYYVQNDF